MEIPSYYVHSKGIKDLDGGEIEEHKTGVVYFSTPANLYFLLNSQRLKKGQPELKPYQIAVILDEADNILDNGTLWRLSAGGGMKGEELKELYYLVNEFYDKNTQRIKAINQETNKEEIDAIVTAFIDKFRKELPDIYRKFLREKCASNNEQTQQAYLRDEVALLLHSADEVNEYEEDKDYVIQQKQFFGAKLLNVAVILKANGELDHASKWGDYAHSLLHARLERAKGVGAFEYKDETNVMTGGTARQLVQDCGTFIGVTGTMGSNRDLRILGDRFGVDDAVKIPTHQYGRRVDAGVCFVSGDAAKQDAEKNSSFNSNQIEQLAAILRGDTDLQNPKSVRENNQPILLLCENLRDAKELERSIKAKLGEKFTQHIQIISGTETEEEKEAKLEKAALTGMITISTPISGRGTDIKPKGEEGLYSLLVTIAKQREEDQMKGRSARNGARGKTFMLLNGDDPRYRSNEGDDAKRLVAVRDRMYKSKEEGVKKQIKQSEIVDKCFQEYCLYKQELLENREQYSGEKLDARFSNQLDSMYCAFMSKEVGYVISTYKMPQAGFDENHFEENVGKKVRELWAEFVKSTLFNEMKIKCALSKRGEESEKVRAKVGEKVTGQVRNLVVQRKKDKDIETHAEKRKEVPVDGMLRDITSVRHHSGTKGGDDADADGQNKHQNEIAITVEGTGGKEYRVYGHQHLPTDGNYSADEQSMIHMDALLQQGYQVSFYQNDVVDETLGIAKEGRGKYTGLYAKDKDGKEIKGVSHQTDALLQASYIIGEKQGKKGGRVVIFRDDIADADIGQYADLTKKLIELVGAADNPNQKFQDSDTFIVPFKGAVAHIKVSELRKGVDEKGEPLWDNPFQDYGVYRLATDITKHQKRSAQSHSQFSKKQDQNLFIRRVVEDPLLFTKEREKVRQSDIFKQEITDEYSIDATRRSDNLALRRALAHILEVNEHERWLEDQQNQEDQEKESQPAKAEGELTADPKTIDTEGGAVV
ncbi:MAG: hypothetical protein O3B09_02485, partial [Proteobacteria bacterium]|nr:hypothetical protein [Pseudomonadota bacterium]